uniref:Uncharacterized protein n=1 Tax=Kuenenia stuttgartiensis TaxID=174633 RepID=Q1Q603_KUEST|nr:unknown protein [Candidatus Kuenenia stuttgartiensis]
MTFGNLNIFVETHCMRLETAGCKVVLFLHRVPFTQYWVHSRLFVSVHGVGAKQP